MVSSQVSSSRWMRGSLHIGAGISCVSPTFIAARPPPADVLALPVATVAPPMLKLLPSRNGCRANSFAAPFRLEIHHLQRQRARPHHLLPRRIGESPITSMPLNFGSMMVLSIAVLGLR